jgi:23S rRNA (uridine2552-2'-O)-methyltransferase
MRRHVNDEFVKRAQSAGYRSRAAFKLIELQQKDRFIKPGHMVVDLGAAPGGWSQLVREWVGPGGDVVALDILPMDPLPGVHSIEADFTTPAALAALEQYLAGREVNVVISDMAPNVSGIMAVDQPRAMYLAELALDFALSMLRQGGTFVTKIFQGEGSDAFLKELRANFQRVVVRKPKASRPESREVYMVAIGRRMQ